MTCCWILGGGLASLSSADASGVSLLSGSLYLEQNYEEKRLRGTGKEWSDIYPTVELDGRVNFDPHWKIRGVFAWEPLRAPEPGEDRVYGSLDVRAKDVYLEYSKDDVGMQVGRITAPFGTAWYLAPGVDATLLAEDYVIWDRAGIKGRKDFQTESYGTVTAEAAYFMLDTSVLSRSARGLWTQKRTDNGGLSNTDDPKSFSMALSGTDLPWLSDLGWHIGAERQAVDKRTDDPTAPARDQYGVVVGLNRSHVTDDRLSFFSLAEVAAFENRKGVPDRNSAFLTLGQRVTYGQYRFEVSGTGERLWDDASLTERENYLGAVTLGYDFMNGLKFDLGYRANKIAGVREDFVRGRISYRINF